MKFFFLTVVSIVIFIGVSALTLDAVAAHLGKPSRGVSYGVSMFYLVSAISLAGGGALIFTKWLGSRFALFLGVFPVFILVVWLLPHPSYAMRSFVAAAIAVVLAIDIMVLWSFARKHHIK